MRRTGNEEVGDENDGDNVVIKVSDLKALLEAWDDADSDAEDVALKKKAVKDAVKAKGIKTDVFALICKLRKLALVDAQGWIEQLNLCAEGTGLNAQLDLLRDVDNPGEPAHGQTLN